MKAPDPYRGRPVPPPPPGSPTCGHCREPVHAGEASRHTVSLNGRPAPIHPEFALCPYCSAALTSWLLTGNAKLRESTR